MHSYISYNMKLILFWIRPFYLSPVLICHFHFRELEEPLMTFDLFEEITQFQSIPKDERLRHVTILIREKLPEDNYHILKFIVQFLGKVSVFI